MRNLGIILIVLGCAGLLFALNMDTTITTDSMSLGYGVYVPSMEVNNIGLMNDKQNYILLSSSTIVLGVILFVADIFLKRNVSPEQTNQIISLNSNESRQEEFPDYPRDLNTDKYKLYLQQKHNIVKNETFGKFVFRDELFELDDALAKAHQYDADLEDEENSKQQSLDAEAKRLLAEENERRAIELEAIHKRDKRFSMIFLFMILTFFVIFIMTRIL